MKVNRKIVDVLIEKFANENKVDEVKVASLVYNALTNIKLSPAAERKPKTASTARGPKSEDSEKVKKFIEAKKPNAEFTVQEVSKTLGLSVSNINSNLRALKKDGIVKETGRVKTGRPGHPPIIWHVTENAH